MRLLLAGIGVSSLGDGISTVTIAWLAVRIAPTELLGLFVGLAIAAYTLPGVIGAWRSEASSADARRAPSSSRIAFCEPVASA